MSESTTQVEQYLENLDAPRRDTLTQVRALILEAVPDAVESMKYRMPTYEYGGAMLCAFASQKRYMSLYMEPPILDGHREELLHLDLGKSCIRFKRIEQLPLAIVRTILQETVQAIDGQQLGRG
jgi:uncharacterized protein YdhG (YjbR/CyaY superfamily)